MTGSQPVGLGVFSDSPRQSTKDGGNRSGVEAGVKRGWVIAMQDQGSKGIGGTCETVPAMEKGEECNMAASGISGGLFALPQPGFITCYCKHRIDWQAAIKKMRKIYISGKDVRDTVFRKKSLLLKTVVGMIPFF